MVKEGNLLPDNTALKSFLVRLWTFNTRAGFKRVLVLALIGIAGSLFVAPYTAAASHPVDSGMVVDGNARFTVITPTLIRLEFSKDGKFINRRSYFAWHRDVKPPQFHTQRESGTLTITTSRLKLTWRGGDDGFNASNLSIQFLNEGGTWKTWRPGAKQVGNLGGTLNALDGCSGREPLPDGVVSRDGWYLLKDHTVLVSDGNNPWIRPRPKSEVADWYFFGYGKRDYHTALKDLTTISGHIPIPPRYMLGAWRSRFHSYTEDQFRQLVLEYNAHKFPLDILVMDMGWHTTPHWGSLDWNKKLIPHPTELLAWLHKRGLHVTLNWHPQGGVGPWYSQYNEFCRAMGIDPAKKKIIPFEDTNEKFMRNYFKLLLDPLEAQGVNFWWLDDGGPYLAWVNALDFWNIGRPSTGHRGASFSRWGGWGNQRYPVSFSGDTSSFWRVLRFEVPFTSTGGNVGADYWSNDVSGFRLNIPSSELFTRWVQFGSLSPVFRTHGTIRFGNYRIPWYYGRQAEESTRRAYDLRSKLLPYIYTSAYLCWKTSLPLVRPLYLDHPSARQAYTHPEEYQFGPSLLVAPIVTRGMGKAWLGAADAWFPKGTWWNLLTNERVNQSGDHPVLASANEIPIFVRGGVPLPMQPVKLRMAEKPVNPLVVRVYPGLGGHFTLYEDDGTSPDYLHDAYALTPLRYENLGEKGVRVIVGPTSGEYKGQPQSRRVIVRLPVTTRPERVTVNGATVPDSSSALPGYTFNPATVTTEVRLPSTSIRKAVEVSVVFKGSQEVQALLPEVVNRIAVTHRALAGAGQFRAGWKLQLDKVLLNLQTLRSHAAQEFGPASSSEVLAGLKSADAELAQIESEIPEYRYQQARAAGFALANAFVSARVRLRKAEAGILARNVIRYRRTFERPNDITGYRTGLLLHVLAPTGGVRDTLNVDVPGLAKRNFSLPEGKQSVYAFLPIMDATQHPLYHYRGTATLAFRSGGARHTLSRGVDVQRQLLNQWTVLGPFAAGQSPEVGDALITPETFRKSYQGKGGKTVHWKSRQSVLKGLSYQTGADNLGGVKRWIDFRIIYPDKSASALAVTWVKAPEAVTCEVSVRHDSGIGLWINRQEIIDSPGTEGVKDLKHPSSEVVKIPLHVGWNQVVVRTESGEKGWGFSVRLHLPEGVVVAQSAEPPSPKKPAQ